MDIEVCQAGIEDVGGLVECTRLSAEEAGRHWLARFERKHAERHMARLVTDGTCFVAKRAGVIIGLIACVPIDVGFAQITDLETAHIYVRPEARSTKAIHKLLEAVEGFAERNGLKVLFHQADYPAAIDGAESNTERVETLFKRRRYQGPIDIVYSVPDYRRVGLTYLFAGDRRSEAHGRLNNASLADNSKPLRPSSGAAEPAQADQQQPKSEK